MAPGPPNKHGHTFYQMQVTLTSFFSLSLKGLTTLKEKEEMLVTTIILFFHNVFKWLLPLKPVKSC